MKWLAAALAVTILLLQYRIWLSADGVRQVTQLHQAVAVQRRDQPLQGMLPVPRDIAVGPQQEERHALQLANQIAHHVDAGPQGQAFP